MFATLATSLMTRPPNHCRLTQSWNKKTEFLLPLHHSTILTSRGPCPERAPQTQNREKTLSASEILPHRSNKKWIRALLHLLFAGFMIVGGFLVFREGQRDEVTQASTLERDSKSVSESRDEPHSETDLAGSRSPANTQLPISETSPEDRPSEPEDLGLKAAGWKARSTPKSDFLSDLQVLSPQERNGFLMPIAAFRLLASALIVGQQNSGAQTEITLDTTRVFDHGATYRAQLRVKAIARDSENTRIELDVRNDSRELFYWVETTGGVPERAGMRAPIVDGLEPIEVQIPPDQLRDFDATPLGIGDLQVGDLLGLSRILEDAALEPHGYDDHPEAGKLLVLGVRFSGEHNDEHDKAPSDEPGVVPAQGIGTSALIYVRVPTLQLHAIRVFDRSDSLVRTYEDFQFRGGSPPWVESFRVTSIPTSSYTEVDLGDLVVSKNDKSAPNGNAQD